MAVIGACARSNATVMPSLPVKTSSVRKSRWIRAKYENCSDYEKPNLFHGQSLCPERLQINCGMDTFLEFFFSGTRASICRGWVTDLRTYENSSTKEHSYFYVAPVLMLSAWPESSTGSPRPILLGILRFIGNPIASVIYTAAKSSAPYKTRLILGTDRAVVTSNFSKVSCPGPRSLVLTLGARCAYNFCWKCDSNSQVSTWKIGAGKSVHKQSAQVPCDEVWLVSSSRWRKSAKAQTRLFWKCWMMLRKNEWKPDWAK